MKERYTVKRIQKTKD